MLYQLSYTRVPQILDSLEKAQRKGTTWEIHSR